jgi:hypothetical protein
MKDKLLLALSCVEAQVVIRSRNQDNRRAANDAKATQPRSNAETDGASYGWSLTEFYRFKKFEARSAIGEPEPVRIGWRNHIPKF